jgi:hypothetical protein
VKAAARVISFLFHPLFLTTYLYGAFYFVLPSAWSPVPLDKSMNMLLLIFLVTFVLPAINIYLFKMLGTISSLKMETRRERVMPFIFIAGVYCAVTYMIIRTTGIYWTDTFIRFLLIVDGLVIASMLITFFYKASIHSLAISGLVGIFLPLNKMSEQVYVFYATLGLIVVAGIVMSARLQLNAHTPREVLVGGLIGLAIGFAGMVMLFSYILSLLLNKY